MYDAETGFYYCNSRYYDPQTGRWLNADAYVSTGQGVLGNNMFAYCGNNPVMYCDPNGERFEKNGAGGFGYFCPAGGDVVRGGGGFFSSGSLSWLDEYRKAIEQTLIPVAIGVSSLLTIEQLKQEKFDIKARERATSVTTDKSKDISAPKIEPSSSYWSATLEFGMIRPIAPLTYSEAQVWVAGGNNLLCRNHAAAIAIVKFWPSARWESRHGCVNNGFLNHYHLSSAHTNHIWYLEE